MNTKPSGKTGCFSSRGTKLILRPMALIWDVQPAWSVLLISPQTFGHIEYMQCRELYVYVTNRIMTRLERTKPKESGNAFIFMQKTLRGRVHTAIQREEYCIHRLIEKICSRQCTASETLLQIRGCCCNTKDVKHPKTKDFSEQTSSLAS